MSSDSGHRVDSEVLARRIAALEQQLQESRQENDELRESEAYWRSLTIAAPVYLSMVDREGRLLFLNRPGEGYRPDEILGRSILEATDPEHRALIGQALKRVFQQGSVENFEACDVNRAYWYSTTAGPLYRDGEIAAAVLCSEDITDKQHMRRELAEAESRWRSLLESAPDIVVLFNAQGEVRFINRTSTAYTAQEVTGRVGHEFVLEQDRQPLQRAIARVFDTGEPQDIELTEGRSGLIYMGRIALIGNLDGEPMAVAFMRDVTQERRRQQKLRENETRLRLAVHQAPIVLWTTDAQLCFTSSMGAGLELLGTAPNANVGRSLYDYFETDDPEFPAIAAHRSALQGRSVEFSQTWNHFVFQSHAEPLREADGTIVGVVGIALNVTARHDTEVQLRRTGSDLEARVRERTAQLDSLNRQLQADIDRRLIVEGELRESEERFRIIAESLPIAVAIVRKSDQKVMYVNRQTCELFATSSRELYQGKVALPCGNLEINQECLAALDQGQSVEDREVQSSTADGTRIWLSFSAVGMQYRGEAAYLCGMIETTGRKEAEKELQQEQALLVRLLDMNEHERQLIGYEIHDGFLQDVTASVMFFESALSSLGEHSPTVAQQIDQGLNLLRESLAEARRLLNNLRTPVLEEAGVVSAIEELIDRRRSSFDFEIEFEAALGAIRLAPALEMAAYRIVQEALNNVQQHSQSPRAKVSIREHDHRLLLEIRDWGVGFDPAKTPKKRYGLTGLLERASSFGGKTVIDSKPGAGTHIRVDIPIVILSSGDDRSH